ncbi:alpha-beta hydrolase superfamily lysophospholipase [Allocatelliglobosispora scoriae]|uniref:Alpha-beta hydrolase superfamily lysophospholipase n=1 Tax=Allocatelliglobosispora scoriae TaxID=643052 RepID=A0A841BWU0_9ACTN|nr:alpha/beta hydrolase [Allocatelliglobosispora scoriae]MBB5872145.1 alpha-beta hydrolase superfamily lysophospholipase [Allocatelliglobosispora scoriae]
METDILGAPYEQRIITLPDDNEGAVVATLVRRLADQPSKRAVLYLHGWNDYFFQTHLADFYLDAGFDFYAIDLRKYGRSLLAHQTPNFISSISDYFPEIDEAVRLIREDGHETVVVNGHSTGGLISSLWLHARGGDAVDGLFLNSPFFDINAPWLVRRAGGVVVSGLAGARPYATMRVSSRGFYGRSLHVEHDGEWSYNLEWKPINSFPVYLGWLKAIRRGQQRLHAGLSIKVPTLVACSDATYRQTTWTDAAHDADAVLDVDHIVRWTPKLGRHITLVRIPGGKHDLTLSRPAAREQTFAELGRWLGAYVAA